MSTLRVGFFFAIAVAASGCDGGGSQDAGNASDSGACKEPIDCPDSGYVDCMPQVGASASGLCACQEKAVAACPGLVFAL
jgi:hypothetical protein